MAKQIRIARLSVRVRAPLDRASGRTLANALARELAATQLAGIERARAIDRLVIPPVRVAHVADSRVAQQTAVAIASALRGGDD